MKKLYFFLFIVALNASLAEHDGKNGVARKRAAPDCSYYERTLNLLIGGCRGSGDYDCWQSGVTQTTRLIWQKGCKILIGAIR